MSLSIILTGSLFAFSSPLAGSSSQCAGPVHPFGAQVHPLETFEQTHRQLRQSVEALRQSVERGEVQIDLRDQVRLDLERLRHFPDQSPSDPSVDALFTQAMLVVAASVQGCDPQFAQAWVDRALARQEIATSSLPRPDLTGLPAEFVTLYDKRALALSTADPATIRLQCEIACVVFVDGHHVAVELGKVAEYPVVPGRHDVWIFHAPDGADPTTSNPTRVSVTELELDSGEQNCLGFPNPSYVGLLPSRQEWWSAWSFARRIDWAIESKKTLVNMERSIFEALVDESPVHTRVLAQAPELRELRVRAALHLADLSQQVGDVDTANTILDRTLLWADLLDSPAMLAAAVGKFPGLTALFEARMAVQAAKPRGTIEVDCGRCLPVIDGVVVDADAFEVPADRYRIEIYPSSARGELIVFDKVIVWENEPTLLRKRSPVHHDLVVPEPVDFREGYQQNPQLQRWVWGTAGGVALAGAAAWSFGLTTWLAPGIRDAGFDPSKFKGSRAERSINLGLLLVGEVAIHAEFAAYFFSRMPPSRRPGSPLVGYGVGLLLTSIMTAGHGVTGLVSLEAAKEEGSVLKERASLIVGVTGLGVTGVLALTGTTLVAIGTERIRLARQNGIVLPARVPRHQRPGFVPIALGSGLVVAGVGFGGLGTAAAIIEPTLPNTPAVVGIVGGGILAIGGVALVGVGAKRKHSSKSHTAVVPSFSHNSLGLQVVGQF